MFHICRRLFQRFHLTMSVSYKIQNPKPSPPEVNSRKGVERRQKKRKKKGKFNG